MFALLHMGSILQEDRATLRQNWGWYVGLGLLLTLLGILGLVFVGAATLLTIVFVGWFFLIGGLAEIAHAVFKKGWSGFWLDLLAGVITAVAGLFILLQPAGGAKVLTMLIGIMFVIDGIFRLGAGIAIKNPYRGWFIIQGLVSLLLAVFIFSEWPYSAIWVIGTLVSVDLLIDGLRLTSFGFAVKQLPPGDGPVVSTSA